MDATDDDMALIACGTKKVMERHLQRHKDHNKHYEKVTWKMCVQSIIMEVWCDMSHANIYAGSKCM